MPKGKNVSTLSLRAKGAFTLLELVIVIIIIGVLSTFGFVQYSKLVEKSRYTEAKRIFATVRKLAIAQYAQCGSSFNNGAEECRVDNSTGSPITDGMDIPIEHCDSEHYFWYSFFSINSLFIMNAHRCVEAAGLGAGKSPTLVVYPPDYPAMFGVQLLTDCKTQTDQWRRTRFSNPW